MNLEMLHDPIFVAKLVDFAIFVGAIVFLYQRYGKAMLVAYQEAQNKAVADATAQRAANEQAVAAARAGIDEAQTIASRMLEVGVAQAQRLVEEERAAAQALAQRLLAHASGELERERYRVRLEVLEDTVERATQAAKDIIRGELTPEKQATLVRGLVDHLEAIRG